MDDYPWPDNDLDDATEAHAPTLEPYVPLEERIEQLMHANATAKRLVGTVYYQRAHHFINAKLDEIIGR